MRSIDVIGQKFGKLTVLEDLGGGKILCKCDCGTIKKYDKYKVRTGHTKSCGCLKPKPNSGQFKRTNRVGERYNHLVILEELGRNRAICRCDCGVVREFSKSRVVNGDIKSCGCSNRGRWLDLTGQKYGKLTVIKEISKSMWLCKCDCGNTTTASTNNLRMGGIVSCGCAQLENAEKARKAMYKFAFENTNIKALKMKTHKNSKTGIKGVQYNEKRKRWIATLMIGGECKLYKTCNSLKEAIEVREQAEELYFKPVIERFKKTHEDK